MNTFETKMQKPGWGLPGLGVSAFSLLVLAAPSLALAQGLSVDGYLRFNSYYGDGFDGADNGFFDWSYVIQNYAAGTDISGNGYQKAMILNTQAGQGDGQVTQLDFVVDGRMSFDYGQATKAGLEYGAHWELDFQSSDINDFVSGDFVAFNDGYVYINSSLGNVKLGDTGDAGYASNQLHVPLLVGAREVSHYSTQELEQVYYANSFMGVDFDASVDDDSNWSLGLGYEADVGGVLVALGLTAQDETLAGSIQASAGGLSFGLNYASEEVKATTEYVAAGVSYEAGALTIGTGVETEIRHLAYIDPNNVVPDFSPRGGKGEVYETNYFLGAAYEVAEGMTLALGVANLDADSRANRSAYRLAVGDASIEPLYYERDRAWVARAAVKVAY